MSDQPKPPLWRVLFAIRHNPERIRNSTISLFNRIYAVEIRAFADWLTPEEPAAPFLAGEDSHNRSQRQQRRRFRQLLLDEADRAEAGE